MTPPELGREDRPVRWMFFHQLKYVASQLCGMIWIVPLPHGVDGRAASGSIFTNHCREIIG